MLRSQHRQAFPARQCMSARACGPAMHTQHVQCHAIADTLAV